LGALVDTSIFVAAEREATPSDHILAHVGVDPEEPVALAAITAGELLLGVELADQTHVAERLAFIEAVLAGWEVLPFGVTEAAAWARLRAQLRPLGVSIGHADLEVAATALARGWSVAPLNRRDFDHVPGLRVLAPSA